MRSNTLDQPKKRLWHTRPTGIVFLVLIFLFLALSIASAFYVIAVYRGLKSGKIPWEKIFSEYKENSLSTVYGMDRPFLGEKNAPAAFAVFLDYNGACEACKSAIHVINLFLLDEYYKDKAKFVIRQFPNIAAEQDTFSAALAAECAHEQGKFREMHNLLFENIQNLSAASIKRFAAGTGLNSIVFNECMDSQKLLSFIEKDIQDALALNIQRENMPAFVIGTSVILGAPTLDELKSAVDALLIQ